MGDQILPPGMGPTFGAAPVDQWSTPLPACATCPHAMWYRWTRLPPSMAVRLVAWQAEVDPALECEDRRAALLDD